MIAINHRCCEQQKPSIIQRLNGAFVLLIEMQRMKKQQLTAMERGRPDLTDRFQIIPCKKIMEFRTMRQIRNRFAVNRPKIDETIVPIDKHETRAARLQRFPKLIVFLFLTLMKLKLI